MSWEVGFCNKCGVLLHEWGANINFEVIEKKVVWYVYLCPVCDV